jgi:segregation and condensation protein A
VSFEVSTPVYEGPFDLLLHLILQEEVELYELELSGIVDAYLAELEQLEETNLEVATEFLLIAATLVELKTRRLLPADDLFDLDEELALWEERDLLLSKLLECKTFKDAAVVFRQRELDASLSIARTAGLDEQFIGLAPDLLDGVTPRGLREAFIRAASPKPDLKLTLDHIAPITASVSDAVSELLDELPRLRRISFRRLTEGLADRIEVVVRFLAVLELFKQGAITIDQARTFGDIDIRWLDADTHIDLVDDYDG